jgi:hypothetical protein
MTALSRGPAVTTPAGSRTTRTLGIAVACAVTTLIVGVATYGTHNDPISILAAFSLAPLLAGPYVHPRPRAGAR